MPLADFKDSTGKWVWYVGSGGTRQYTKAGILWWCRISRCKEGGAHQRNNPNYAGIKNEFVDFQQFCEWCQSQIGYGAQNFNLDKDLLSTDEKAYSPETCVFLPQQINVFIVARKRGQWQWPRGVSYFKRAKLFRTECDPSGFCEYKKHVGYFRTSEEAFAAYKQRKEEIAVRLAEKWKDKVDPRAYEALKNFTVNIGD